MPVLGDTTIEPTRPSPWPCPAPANATSPDARALGTIPTTTRPDALHQRRPVTEGNSGTTNAVFTVSLSAAEPGRRHRQLRDRDGTATAGSDYTATIRHPHLRRRRDQQDGDRAGPRRHRARGRRDLHRDPLRRDERDHRRRPGRRHDHERRRAPRRRSRINDVTVTEGNSRHDERRLHGDASRPPARRPSRVSYATANGTATAGSDYVAASGTLTFAAGETSKTLTRPVLGDTDLEPDETFAVTLCAARSARRSAEPRVSARSPTTTRWYCRPCPSTVSR